jgi:hypothetical protein
VHPSSIELIAKVPFAVFLFRNKISERIKEKAIELLAGKTPIPSHSDHYIFHTDNKNTFTWKHPMHPVNLFLSP